MIATLRRQPEAPGRLRDRQLPAASPRPGRGWHISPVAAYDKKSDSFLVLDVNPNRAPWVWTSAADLVAAMRTPDRTENRGYLLVREGSTPAAGQ